jgi:hypothetical protein
VVDASGEFGLLGHSEFLAGARVFGEDGKLKDGESFVYYDHRHSRGTDAVLDADAIGYVVVDWATTTRTVAAQAMYRLRQLYDGKNEDKKQKVVFVVCGSDGPESEAQSAAKTLYARLVQNEHTRADRLALRAKVQVDRAEKQKRADADFVFPIDAGDVQAEQEQEQEREVEQEVEEEVVVEHNQCVHVRSDPRFFDPFVQYEDDSYQAATLRNSKLHKQLLEARVHLSPLIITNYSKSFGMERAFVVTNGTDHTATLVTLCMQIETLVAYDDHKQRRGEVSVYSASGLLLRGEHVEDGLVLFGRYLCGDEMPHEEQRDLLVFLKERYRDKEGIIHEVMKCLVAAEVVRGRAGLLRALHTKENWQNESATASPESDFIDSVMRVPSFGRRYV